MKRTITSNMIVPALLFFFLMISSVLNSATIYVNSATGNDATGNGTSGNPYKTFHKGYTMASAGDILDLTGTFTWTDADETGDATTTGYTLTKNITIQGQGASSTIIQAATTANTADRRLFSANNGVSSFTSMTFKNLTIRYGKCDITTGDANQAAGILIRNKTGDDNLSVTIIGCIFQDNNLTGGSAGFSGAAFAFTDYGYGNFLIDKCLFKNNSANMGVSGAGAVYVAQDVNATISNSTFEGNQGLSQFGSYWCAGALFAARFSTVILTNCTFVNNSSQDDGGAIVIDRVTDAYFTNNTIVSNTASNGDGGGIRTYDSRLYLKNNLIGNNTANGSSNDIYKEGGTFTDNGYNIVENSPYFNFNATGDITGDQANLFGTGISSTPALGNHGTINGTPTIALSSGSVAINAGNATANSTVTIPTTDQRGMNRNSTVDIGAYEYGGTSGSTTWTGNAATSDWGTAGNWNNGVPNSGSEVIIPNGTTYLPEILGGYDASNPATCMNLTLGEDALLNIKPGKALTVNGSLTVNNLYGIYIESDATGTGSLINFSDNVSAVIEIYLTGSSNLLENKYHQVSIPANVTNPLSGIFLDLYLYKLDPTLQNVNNSNYYGVWESLGSSTTTPLSIHKGYMVYYPGPFTSFALLEYLNNGDFSCDVTGHAGTYTFNLVPNPYPSSVNWGATAGWTKSAGIGGTCYIWNSTSGNYSSLVSTSDNYIPVGQAFIVAVYNEGSPSLTVKNAARAHSTQAFYKSSGLQLNALTIKASANNYSDVTEIAFSENATEAFDLQIDGMKLLGLEEAPQLYTLASDAKYSINNLPVFADQKIVPMNFETQFTGEVTLTFSNIESFETSLNIYLQDLISNKTVNLRNQSTYTFSHNPANQANRFNLVFGGTIGVDEMIEPAGNLWISGNTLYINTPGLAGQAGLLEVYDASGRILMTKELVLNEFSTIDLSQHGFVVVKLTTGKELMTVKGILIN